MRGQRFDSSVKTIDSSDQCERLSRQSNKVLSSKKPVKVKGGTNLRNGIIYFTIVIF